MSFKKPKEKDLLSKVTELGNEYYDTIDEMVSEETKEEFRQKVMKPLSEGRLPPMKPIKLPPLRFPSVLTKEQVDFLEQEDKFDFKTGNYRRAPEGSPWRHGVDDIRREAARRNMSPNQFADQYEYFDEKGYDLKGTNPTLREDYNLPGDEGFDTNVFRDGQSFVDPEQQTISAMDQVERLGKDAQKFLDVRQRDNTYNYTRPMWAERKARIIEKEKEALRDQGQLMSVEVDDEVDIDGTSYASESEEVKLDDNGMSLDSSQTFDGMSMEVDSTEEEKAAPRKPVAPKSITRNPEAMLKRSQETGENWQDLLVDAYTADNPWIDRVVIEKAVYRAADKHLNRFKQSGGRGNYMSSLAKSLRGRGGSKKSDKSNYDSFMTDNIKEKAQVLRGARKTQLEFVDDQRSKVKESNPTIVGEDGLVKNQQALNDYMADVQSNSFYARDGEVEAAYRSLPQSFEKGKSENVGKVGYYGLQVQVIQDLEKELARRAKENDPETLRLLSKYTPKGKKPGRQAFTQAAKEIFKGVGLYDSAADRGKRGIQKKAEKKRRKKKYSKHPKYSK